MLDNLRGERYQAQLKKSRENYEVKVMLGQGNKAKERFFIHFDKLSPDLYARTGYISEREARNAVVLELNHVGKPLHVKRIEDIIPHKVRRVKRRLFDLGEQMPLLEALSENAERMNWAELAAVPLKNWSNAITRAQNDFPPEQKSYPPKYSVNKDLYDLCLLARKIEGTPGSFNRAYYLEAKSQIDHI